MIQDISTKGPVRDCSLPIPRSLIQKRYDAFDGLRGLAILLVFANHYGVMSLPINLAHSLWFGVDLFFVLSGFLITGILFDAQGAKHFFRTFYIRRSLRIFPLYYSFFLLVFLLTPVLHLKYSLVTWSYLLYLGNIMLALHHNPTMINFGHSTLGLGPLWSLCVEEQFYLIWPWLLSRLQNRTAIMRFSACVVLATFCLRTALFFYDPAEVAKTHYLYFLTFTRWDSLFMGCWVAAWLRGVELTPKQIGRISHMLILIPLAVLTIGGFTVGRKWPFNEVNPLVCTYGYDLVGFVSVGILFLALDETSTLHRVLKNRALSALGIVSYGFYFFHGMPLGSVLQRHESVMPGKAGGLLISIVCFSGIYLLSWTSFRFFETPFLRLKRTLAPTETRAARAVGSAFSRSRPMNS